ncbi:LysR family transcriptional regulator [Streptomyces sp. NPDC058464]|uniref:LysR family transcriptional regulator n=1 Tax=Streptomyces sp. NPDC058464 TaxID=3346511 RepID=UPI003646DCE5
MKSQPDLKLLATFLAVLRRGSMTEAAAELGYVPSAVSQHIAALERDMAVELIVRRPGSRLVLTAAGRALAQATETLFDVTGAEPGRRRPGARRSTGRSSPSADPAPVLRPSTNWSRSWPARWRVWSAGGSQTPVTRSVDRSSRLWT